MNSKPETASVSEKRFGWGQALQWWIRRGLPLAFGLALAFLGAYLYSRLFPAPIPPTQADIEASIQQVMASATPPPAPAVQVYQVILPSLVLIQTQRAGADTERGFGMGSGVVVNENGDILTALHVVDGAQEIEIFFADGTRSQGVIAAAEPENDIAVLQASPPPELIVPAVLGNPGALRIGDEAYAVGNPLGFAASLSAGVVSGFDRSITPQNSEQRLEGLIQFDTAVNPGSSGGPLLNRQGQVVGIVTALANPSEENFFIGIGFAIPIATAVSVAGGPSY